MEHGGMRDLRARAATAGAALAGVLALTGCTNPAEADTAPLVSADAISAALGGEPDGRELRATPAALEARFGPWEKP